MQKITAMAIAIAAAAGLAAAILIYGNSSEGQPFAPQPAGKFLAGVEIPDDRYLQANVTVNDIEIKTDIAATSDQRRKGLAVKDTLNEDEGMLFVFENEARHSMWMKDMKFPIDIIWLDGNKTVVHIEQKLEPCSPFKCPSYVPDGRSLYVLETVAGFAEKHGVVPGTKAEFELLG